MTDREREVWLFARCVICCDGHDFTDHTFGDGLFLRVHSDGRREWYTRTAQRYHPQFPQFKRALPHYLGRFPDMSPVEARAARERARKRPGPARIGEEQ